MSAQAVRYIDRNHPDCDSLKVVCDECGVEWGHGHDSDTRLYTLQGLADAHNKRCHQPMTARDWYRDTVLALIALALLGGLLHLADAVIQFIHAHI